MAHHFLKHALDNNIPIFFLSLKLPIIKSLFFSDIHPAVVLNFLLGICETITWKPMSQWKFYVTRSGTLILKLKPI